MSGESPARLDAVDFTLGLLNAVEDIQPGHLLNCRNRSIDRAFEDAAGRLLRLIEMGEVQDIDMRFRIITHPLHGDSERVYETMSFLFSLGYIEQTHGPYYRFNRGRKATAQEFHEQKRIPGTFDLYKRLAGRFISITLGDIVEPIDSFMQAEHERGQRPSPA